MSKASKSARALKRKREKKSRKEMNRARYAAMTEAGQNKKSKRVQLKAKRQTSIRVKSHPYGPCGNTGCKRCCPMTRHQHEERQARIAEGMAKSQARKALKAKLAQQALVEARAARLAAKMAQKGLAATEAVNQ